MTFDSAIVDRAGQVSADIVEKRLNTLVLERRTKSHRHDLHLQSSVADSATDLFFCDGGRIVEIFFHQDIVELSDLLKHFITPFFSFSLKICRDFLEGVVSTHRFVMPENSFHADKVNDTFECLFSTDRNLDRTGIGTENILQLAYNLKEVSARTVHLVNVTDTGNVVLVSLTPHSLRLRLNATYCTESSDSTVEHTERTFNFHSEVNVSGGVNKVDLVFVSVVVPESGCSGRCDSDTALLFLFHPVHGSATIVHLADFMSQTRIEKDTLRCRCLAGIDVSHNTDITGKFQLFVCFAHFNCLSIVINEIADD